MLLGREGPGTGLEGRLVGVLDGRRGLGSGRRGPGTGLEGRLVGVLDGRRGLGSGREGPGTGLEGRLLGAFALRRGSMVDRRVQAPPPPLSLPSLAAEAGQNSEATVHRAHHRQLSSAAISSNFTRPAHRILKNQLRDSQWLALERHRGATAGRTSDNEGLTADSANGNLEKQKKAGLSLFACCSLALVPPGQKDVSVLLWVVNL